MSKGQIPPRQQFLDDVQADQRVAPMTFMVAFALSSFVNWSTRACWPSQAALAQKARTTPRTVRTELDRLVAFGFIAVIRETNRREGNRYEVPSRYGRAPMLPGTDGDGPLSPRSHRKPASYGHRKQASYENAVSWEAGFLWPSEAHFPRNSLTELLNSNPHPLLGGDGRPKPSSHSEAEAPQEAARCGALDQTFEQFLEVYPFDAAMGVAAARREFEKLSAEDRALAVRCAPVVRDALRRRGPKATAMHAAAWLAGRAFDEIQTIAAAKRAPTRTGRPQVFVIEGTPAWQAWMAHRRREGKVGCPTRRDPVTGDAGWLFETMFPAGLDDAEPASRREGVENFSSEGTM